MWITAHSFFKAWSETTLKNRDVLEKIWRQNTEFTSIIKGSENCILKQIADKLNLKCYDRDYYFLDAVFYKNEDFVENTPAGSFWFKDLRIAFEHENNFNSGLYKEISHLLLTNADLKVLVTYPNGEIDYQMKYLHSIIKSSRNVREISRNENFLIILGYERDFTWEGYIFKMEEWEKI